MSMCGVDVGEVSCQEMSRYTMELIMDKWVKPSVDISKWEFYDLSCKDPYGFLVWILGTENCTCQAFFFSACFELQERDATSDQVLKDIWKLRGEGFNHSNHLPHLP